MSPKPFTPQEEKRFTDWLREKSEPAWTRATTHRFTRELADDTLDDEVFKRYLVQDYAFINTLVSVVGYAVGDAYEMEEKSQLSDFLSTLTSDENDYFERSFDSLGVESDQRDNPKLTRVTKEFRELMLLGAHKGEYAETLGVLLPVEWVYLTWAKNASGSSPSRFYLKEWIDLHANPEFEGFVNWLRGQLDAYGPHLSPTRQNEIRYFFTRAVELEVEFFDSAYSD